MKRFLQTLTLVFFIAPFAKAQDLPSYIPTDGLVAYYPFNGNANDTSGNNYNLVNNNVTYESDKFGTDSSAAYFSGNASELFLEESISQLTSDPKQTYSFWFKSITPSNRYIFEYASQNNGRFRFVTSPTGGIGIRGETGCDSGGRDYVISNLHEGWHHFVIAIDTQTYTVYYDGEVLYNAIHSGFDCTDNVNKLNLGNDIGGGAKEYTNMLMDDIGIWNRALTEQEIQNLYNSSTGDIILNGVVSAENNQIKNVADPTDAQDAVTKNYTYSKTEVDALIANLQQQINEMNDNQVASSIELVEVFLMPNSRNFIKTSDSKYIIRTESDVFESNAIDGNYESLNFNINVDRGDIHGHLLGETPSQSILISTKDNGLFRFENETWGASGLSGYGTSGNDFLRLNNDRILIAKQGFSRKIYYSDDNGFNWSTSSGTDNEDWRDFSVSSSGSIFIGSPGNNVGGVLRSQDNGLSFERIRTEKCRSTSTIGEVVYIISLNEENNNVLMKSTDNGATWTELFIFNDFKSGGYVEITFYAGNIIVLNDEKIFWSKIDEINFSETLLPSDYGSFREISHIDDKIYVVYDKGIFAVNGQY